jgi:hypothetical protein
MVQNMQSQEERGFGDEELKEIKHQLALQMVVAP